MKHLICGMHHFLMFIHSPAVSGIDKDDKTPAVTKVTKTTLEDHQTSLPQLVKHAKSSKHHFR